MLSRKIWRHTVRTIDGVGMRGSNARVDQRVNSSETKSVRAFHTPERIDANGAEESSAKGSLTQHFNSRSE